MDATVRAVGERSALVTGATGFIGSHLVPALLADGWTVRASGRRPRPETLPAAAAYQPVDFVDGSEEDLHGLVAGITHVFHLAGASSSKSSQDEMMRDNVGATERLLAACGGSGGRPGGDIERFVYMSSTSVYGEETQLPSPVPEDAAAQPSRGYGKAKYETEQVVWRHGTAGLPVVVLRPVSVHGPGAIKLVASVILDIALERFMGLDRLVVNRQPVEQRLVHIDDLVAATLHLATHPGAPGRAFNIASGVYPTSHGVAEILAGYFGMSLTLVDDPDAGPSDEERESAWRAMRDRGMTGDILLTKERFRFMRKQNRNNRLALDNLQSTGFELRHTDPAVEIPGDADWYRANRWIV